MARISDSSTLLEIPLAPDFFFALTDTVQFFVKRRRVARGPASSLLVTLKRILQAVPPGHGYARMRLKASRGRLDITLGLSRARLPASRLRPLLRQAHPSLKTALRPTGTTLFLSVPIPEKR